MNKLFIIIAFFFVCTVFGYAGDSYWTGDGGKGIRLGILVPESQGLTSEQAYLPAMVQGCLVANITKYSAIDVLDRVALDKVIEETLDPTYEDNLDIIRLGHVAQAGYMMTGKVLKTSYGYTLQINVTDTTPNAKTIASYSGNCTVSQLDDQSAIQIASQELLTKMGVHLSDRAKNELGTTNRQTITVQTWLAQGITAEKQGNKIEALSYYFQAAKFDPSIPEAANRSNVLAANISSGNIGNDLRNDVQWRKDWVARLAETEQYVKSYNDYYTKYYRDYYTTFYKDYTNNWDNFLKELPDLPYTLFYTADVHNSGVVDYKTETTGFTGINAYLRPSKEGWIQSVEKVIETQAKSVQAVQTTVQAEQTAVKAAIQELVKTVNDGLDATKRKDIWGLQHLNTAVTEVIFDSSFLNRQKQKQENQTFSVTVELVNSLNKVIGSSTFRTGVTYSITRTEVSVSEGEFKTVDFPNVNVNDITDELTIRIAAINGIAADTAVKTGVMQIQAISKAEWDFNNNNCIVKNGQIIKYTGKGGDIVIPDTVWGEPITSIGDYAFAGEGVEKIYEMDDSKYNFTYTDYNGIGLTSVTIGNSIKTIGKGAFEGNKMKNVIMGDGVTYIGEKAFSENRLTSVIIGNNVKTIGDYAFSNNDLASVTISNSVGTIGRMAFYGNSLTSVIIPNGVTEIKEDAFSSNFSLKSITIGANVTLEPSRGRKIYNADYFDSAYNKNSKRAGTYNYDKNRKTWRLQRSK